MMIKGREIGTRFIIGVVGIIVIIMAMSFGVSQCSKRKNGEAQGRVDQAQGGAFQNSAAEAGQVQATVNANEVASEQLGRDNEREIRNAEGSNAVVAAPARDAAIASLCRRKAYSGSERCRLLNAR